MEKTQPHKTQSTTKAKIGIEESDEEFNFVPLDPFDDFEMEEPLKESVELHKKLYEM